VVFKYPEEKTEKVIFRILKKIANVNWKRRQDWKCVGWITNFY